jgi:hypothetical protein
MTPSRNWDSPTPSRQRVCPSPRYQRGEGHSRLRVRGWGSPNSDDKKLSTLPESAYSVELGHSKFFWGGYGQMVFKFSGCLVKKEKNTVSAFSFKNSF